MSIHRLPFGGMGEMQPHLGQSDALAWRRILDAATILGPGGHIQDWQAGGFAAMSAEEKQAFMAPYRYFAGRGLDNHFVFQWFGESLSTEEKKAIKDVLDYFAAHPEAGVKSLQLGSEIQQHYDHMDDYGDDLEWLLGRVADLSLDLPVFGPSVVANVVPGQPIEQNKALLTIQNFFDLENVPENAGIDVHRFAPWLIPISSTDPFYLCVDIAKNYGTPPGRRVIAVEFCGCTWGQVWCPEDETPYYRGELMQAWIGTANILRAMAKGVDTVFWSHFPSDVVWDGSTPVALLNHTGMCTGPGTVGECYEAAGRWRHMARVYQFLAESWRTYNVADTGVVVTSPAPPEGTSVYSFAVDVSSPAGVLYAFHRDVEDHHPAEYVIDAEGKEYYLAGDLARLRWEKRPVVDDEITVTIQTQPGLVIVP